METISTRKRQRDEAAVTQQLSSILSLSEEELLSRFSELEPENRSLRNLFDSIWTRNEVYLNSIEKSYTPASSQLVWHIRRLRDEKFRSKYSDASILNEHIVPPDELTRHLESLLPKHTGDGVTEQVSSAQQVKQEDTLLLDNTSKRRRTRRVAHNRGTKNEASTSPQDTKESVEAADGSRSGSGDTNETNSSSVPGSEKTYNFEDVYHFVKHLPPLCSTIRNSKNLCAMAEDLDLFESVLERLGAFDENIQDSPAQAASMTKLEDGTTQPSTPGGSRRSVSYAQTGASGGNVISSVLYPTAPSSQLLSQKNKYVRTVFETLSPRRNSDDDATPKSNVSIEDSEETKETKVVDETENEEDLTVTKEERDREDRKSREMAQSAAIPYNVQLVSTVAPAVTFPTVDLRHIVDRFTEIDEKSPLFVVDDGYLDTTPIEQAIWGRTRGRRARKGRSSSSSYAISLQTLESLPYPPSYYLGSLLAMLDTSEKKHIGAQYHLQHSPSPLFPIADSPQLSPIPMTNSPRVKKGKKGRKGATASTSMPRISSLQSLVSLSGSPTSEYPNLHLQIPPMQMGAQYLSNTNTPVAMHSGDTHSTDHHHNGLSIPSSQLSALRHTAALSLNASPRSVSFQENTDSSGRPALAIRNPMGSPLSISGAPTPSFTPQSVGSDNGKKKRKTNTSTDKDTKSKMESIGTPRFVDYGPKGPSATEARQSLVRDLCLEPVPLFATVAADGTLKRPISPWDTFEHVQKMNAMNSSTTDKEENQSTSARGANGRGRGRTGSVKSKSSASKSDGVGTSKNVKLEIDTNLKKTALSTEPSPTVQGVSTPTAKTSKSRSGKNNKGALKTEPTMVDYDSDTMSDMDYVKLHAKMDSIIKRRMVEVEKSVNRNNTEASSKANMFLSTSSEYDKPYSSRSARRARIDYLAMTEGDFFTRSKQN